MEFPSPSGVWLQFPRLAAGGEICGGLAGGRGREREVPLSLGSDSLLPAPQLPGWLPGSRAPGLPGSPRPGSAGALPLRLAEAGGRQAAGGGVVESAGNPQPRRAWRPP